MNEKDKRLKYLQACRIMDLYKEIYNPCKITKDKNGNITCKGVFCYRKELCCKGCKHLSSNGCTTSSLACKLSFCYIKNTPYMGKLYDKYSIENKRFILLRNIILKYLKKHDIPFIWGRASYEETIKLNKNIIIKKTYL